MNKVVFFFFCFFSVSAFSCDGKYSSEIYTCVKKELSEAKEKMDDDYNMLLKKTKSIKELNEKVVQSQKYWNESILKDCEVFSYFIEDDNITYSIENELCITKKYKERDVFILDLYNMVSDFM